MSCDCELSDDIDHILVHSDNDDNNNGNVGNGDVDNGDGDVDNGDGNVDNGDDGDVDNMGCNGVWRYVTWNVAVNEVLVLVHDADEALLIAL